MTNEVAIECIKDFKKSFGIYTYDADIKELIVALDMAIKALEQQTCENINEDYDDCDQFKCSECQIELQDWHRVERDEDYGDITYHEYTFRYCPNCGRRVKRDEQNSRRRATT